MQNPTACIILLPSESPLLSLITHQSIKRYSQEKILLDLQARILTPMVVFGADTFAATGRESGILPVWNAEEAAISEAGFILLRNNPVQESEEESLA